MVALAGLQTDRHTRLSASAAVVSEAHLGALVVPLLLSDTRAEAAAEEAVFTALAALVALAALLVLMPLDTVRAAAAAADTVLVAQALVDTSKSGNLEHKNEIRTSHKQHRQPSH